MTSAHDELLPVALRDTALIVADFAGKHTEQPAEDLRDQCEAQIKALKAELTARGWPHDAIEDALYAQCALLDETALRDLQGRPRDEWERQPLQLTQFDTNNAGEELVKRIEKRLHETQPLRPLLAIFGAALDLGFTGRLALESGDAKAKLREAIDTRLGVTRSPHDDASIVVKTAVARPWTRRISPLACIGLACVAVGLVWFGTNRWLDASVARITH
ncbi:type VI secretion protein ImpK (plasmid) [Burkholderia sp. THE68]|nr:type VI secretion protein ImpK [Burkholderia sp. THE68]